jgi:hypothetical protein
MAKGYPDYEGDKQRVYLAPEWAAKEAVDKNFLAYLASGDFGDGPNIDYTVPADKTLFITQVGWSCLAAIAANGELNQMCSLLVYNATTVTFVWDVGGNGGGSSIFNKPITVTTGQRVIIYCTNKSNHACEMYVTAGGYEV